MRDERDKHVQAQVQKVTQAQDTFSFDDKIEKLSNTTSFDDKIEKVLQLTSVDNIKKLSRYKVKKLSPLLNDLATSVECSSTTGLVPLLAKRLTENQAMVLLENSQELELPIATVRALEVLVDNSREGKKQYWKLLETSEKKSTPVATPITTSLLNEKMLEAEEIILKPIDITEDKSTIEDR